MVKQIYYSVLITEIEE